MVDTSAFERQIDEMVYKLYSLTDEEIAIVEVKGQAHVLALIQFVLVLMTK